MIEILHCLKSEEVGRLYDHKDWYLRKPEVSLTISQKEADLNQGYGRIGPTGSSDPHGYSHS
jgi:hypothetical protein